MAFIVGLNVITSCVSHKAKYKGSWERLSAEVDPYYTVFLIGDAGYSSVDGDNEVFDHLEKALNNQNKNSAIIWLGDNIYPVGLAPSTSIYSSQGRYRLLAQLNTMRDYVGQKYFVPGNHDWYTYGRVGLRRQELLIDSFLHHTPNPNDQDDYFLPSKGCGDPQIVDLKEDIALLLMDSHWFLEEKARIGDQSVCDVKTTEDYLQKIAEEVDRNKDKALIIASHHPPFTYAHHGGKFPLKDDLFPITQKVDWLYIPIPFAGVLFNRIRLRMSEQDVYHPMYKQYRSKLVEVLESKGRSIVASGHEHTLQLIENHNQYFIVSGAGTKNNKVGMGKGSRFGIGEQGYVKVVFLDSKVAKIQFIVPGLYEEHDNVAYEKLVTLE